MPEPKHVSIEKALLDRIGKMSPGARLPNELELCKDFSVSRMTMNKILSRLAANGLLCRIRKKGTFVSERSHSGPIYFLTPELEISSFDSSFITRRILRGLTLEASKRGRKVELLPVCLPGNHDVFLAKEIMALPAGADVFVMSYWYRRLFPALRDRQCRVVHMNPDVWLEDEYKECISGWHSIGIDRRGGVETALSHLWKTGRRRPLLVYAHDEKDHPVTGGFRRGLSRLGIAHFPEMELFSEYHIDVLPDLPGRIVRRVVDGGFDAVLFPLHSWCHDIVGALKAQGLAIPGDVAVVSLCEHGEMVRCDPPVTALAWPLQELGRRAAAFFCGDADPDAKPLAQVLIVRDSTVMGAGASYDLEFMPEMSNADADLMADVIS